MCRPKAGFLASLLLSLAVSLVSLLPNMACTEVILNKSAGFLVSGRTLDYNCDLGSKICFREKGEQLADPGLKFTGIKSPALSWKAKYSAVLVDAFELPAFVDAMNTEGLSVACLWHADTEAASVTEEGRKALSNVALVEYLAENAATVDEAKKLVSGLSLYLSTYNGQAMTLHWIITDKNGKSTVLELKKGKPLFFDQVSKVGVMTNQPDYDKQLAKLDSFEENCRKGISQIPGDYDSSSRFLKSAFLVSHLPALKDESEAVAAAFQVLHNVESPQGAQKNGSYTQWFVVRDHKNLKYWLSDVKHPGTKMVDLNSADFKKLAKLRIPVDSAETGNLANLHLSMSPLMTNADRKKSGS